uniref:Uncharacterized protein n=1 Tax=Anguilla anguilla TaxID=7936 RepID=A0A0E9RB39_ANGAN
MGYVTLLLGSFPSDMAKAIFTHAHSIHFYLWKWAVNRCELC